MIAKMSKVFVAASLSDRENLLTSLRDCGVVHIVPVDPKLATPDEQTEVNADVLGRAIQILEAIETPSEASVGLEPVEVAEKVLSIHHTNAERANNLAGLHRQIQQLAIWGDVTLKDFEDLKQAGVEPKFYSVLKSEVPATL